jgi:predicted amidohydrolase YtcJ
VTKRLGIQRAKYGAYPWRSLLDAGAVVTNGTDTPVEDISPIESFYASVTRQRTNPAMVFFPEQSMTRAEAIHSYTLACAYSAFEEDLKGSLEVGKLADLVVLSNDLINCSDSDILNTKVLTTIVGGKIKFQKE